MKPSFDDAYTDYWLCQKLL